MRVALIRSATWLAVLVGLSLGWQAAGQGLVADQGVGPNSWAAEYGVPIARTNSAASAIVEQSFVPSKPILGFVQLLTWDGQPTNGVGATLVVSIRQDTWDGPIVGTSQPVSLPDGKAGFPGDPTNTFYFSPQVRVVPGRTYFVEPIIQSGDNWQIGVLNASFYTSGSLFEGGQARPPSGLTFEEGVVVPQLSVAFVTNQWLNLSWSSVTNDVFSLQRSNNLAADFTDLVTNIVATPPTNVYIDRSATNTGPYFYRVKLGP